MLTVKVLYSEKDRKWKVTDFGLTMAATSKKLRTTQYARGTGGYRAPELVRDDPRYNQKADIFAAGCILFELATRGKKKAFNDDFAVREYAISPSPELDIPLDAIKIPWREEVSKVILDTLSIDPLRRPPAAELCAQFGRNRSISIGDTYYQIQEYGRAIDHYLRAVNLGAISASTYKKLGDAYKATGQNQDAILAFRSAIDAGCDKRVWIDLGDCLYSVANFEEAIKSYEHAIEINPRERRIFPRTRRRADSTIVEKLGKAYAEIGENDLAIKVFETASDAGPGTMIAKCLQEARAKKKELDSLRELRNGQRPWYTWPIKKSPAEIGMNFVESFVLTR